MTSHEPTLTLPQSALPCTTLEELTQETAARLDAGDRLLTFCGRPDADDHVMVNAVLQKDTGVLNVLRGRGKRGETYSSLTSKHACAHMFERELWEQTGLVPNGHPWLKPVRFERERQKQMGDYPFFSVRGKEVHEVGVGPIHAGVIEPGHFRFMCLGEVVQHLEIQLGYQHRGVEALLLKRAPLALTPLIESIAGDSSIAYAWAYCAAMESLAGVEVPLEVDAVRGIALELERIGMHLVGLAGLTTDIAFLQGAATYGRLRTAIINASMRACGSRFGRGWLRPGGVRAGISTTLRDDLRSTLAAFSRDFDQVTDLVVSARTVRARFKGVGAVSLQAANDVGLFGPAGRACGLTHDARQTMPGRVGTTFPIEPVSEATGDCWARMRMRQREIASSLRWIVGLLDSPTLKLEQAALTPVTTLRADTLSVSIREGWRGAIVHVVETNADGALLHYKVQDPSLNNWFGLALALRGTEISDFPICNKSFDLSYCGNDL